MHQFIVTQRETCPTCDANGNPCTVCNGLVYRETLVDLAAALKQLGVTDALLSQQQAIQDLREATSPDHLQEIARRGAVLAHRESGRRP